MKVFSSRRRAVPEARKKYGRPESRSEMLQRQKGEREMREAKERMISSILSKNRNEFHFGYYSVGKNMVKRVDTSLDELRKTLKYVDSEILRCERKLQYGIAVSEDGLGSRSRIPDSREFEEYVEALKKKRQKLAERIDASGL